MSLWGANISWLIGTIERAGGTPVMVGGAVRDMVMNDKMDPFEGPSADYDIEVFGITLPKLQDALSEAGLHWDEVGEHFSVLKVRVEGIEQPVDLSIPRYEKSTGDGHREFEVMADPSLTFAEAAKRRDVTMNAMGYNLTTDELVDPYNGVRDIRAKVVRVTSPAFEEDPLRVLRVARFAARFDFTPTWATKNICLLMWPQASSLPSERVWMEIEKAVHECKLLGDFFFWLFYLGWIDIFPEVRDLVGVEQDTEWHPEGDVFTHTVAALNYWSQNLRTGNKEDDLITAIAILCHDFGKVTTSEWNEEKQHITAYGHEEAGAEPTRTFLHRLRQYELAKEVVPLVENHLAPVYGPHTPRSLRRLSTKVKRLDILANVSRADQAGRPPKSYDDGFYKIEEMEDTLLLLEIPTGGPKPLVGGDYLLSIGLPAGPQFKEILDVVYNYQLDGLVSTEEEAQFSAVGVAIDKGWGGYL